VTVRAPNLAANKPPETNTAALATPANNLCPNKMLAAVKKPVIAISKDANMAPMINTQTAPQRFKAHGVNNAPTK
jgi:hypothetical protein